MNSKLPETILNHINVLEQELVRLKKDIIHSLAVKEKAEGKKPTLFGSVKSEDIPEEMIEESKKSLFGDFSDI
jgi:hypothetical protein